MAGTHECDGCPNKVPITVKLCSACRAKAAEREWEQRDREEKLIEEIERSLRLEAALDAWERSRGGS